MHNRADPHMPTHIHAYIPKHDIYDICLFCNMRNMLKAKFKKNDLEEDDDEERRKK